jgi:hypothetical protein
MQIEKDLQELTERITCEQTEDKYLAVAALDASDRSTMPQSYQRSRCRESGDVVVTGSRVNAPQKLNCSYTPSRDHIRRLWFRRQLPSSSLVHAGAWTVNFGKQQSSVRLRCVSDFSSVNRMRKGSLELASNLTYGNSST